MKIALFTGNYNHIADGVSLTLNRLVAFLEKMGLEVIVFGPSVFNPPVNHSGTLEEVPSIPAIGRPEYRISLTMGQHAKKVLDDFNPDIIHIATPDILGLLALRYAKKNDIPAVSTYHTHFSSYLRYYGFDILEPLLWKYLKWFYANCEELYVPSDSMKQVLEDEGIQCDIKIWERGIETDKFSDSYRSSSWRSENGFEDHKPIILFVSRLVWEKGLKTVIDTYKRFKEDAHWCIVGDGPALADMEKEMPKAVFTGKLSGVELSTAYASSDVFFFPSDTETFGNVTLEALASGLPAVVADATGSKSLVTDGVNGKIVPPDDAEGFAKALGEICLSTNLRKQMASNALESAKPYSWDLVLQKMVTFYGQILNSDL